MALREIGQFDFQNASVHFSEVMNDEVPPLPYKPISGDSHVTEPPNCYTDYIDPKYRDIAPHTIRDANGGDYYVIDGMEAKISMSGIASAGVATKDLGKSRTFEDIHRGGFDGKARVKDQDRDGVGGEVVYPSVGMVLCNHPDPSYKKACFDAYNLWLQGYQAEAPDRIFGVGQSAIRSVEEAIADFQKIKEMGLYGVMMPNEPATEVDYDDPSFDPLWKTAVELNLPLSFHVLTGRAHGGTVGSRGHNRGTGQANFYHEIIRANQDIISMFIWGRVFERFPDLRIVCVEADAGWAPHFMYRMDHFYKRHRFWSKTYDMTKLPSEFFSNNVYVTCQDDFTAFRNLDMINPRRLLWASDFPHSDSFWPWSQQMIAHTLHEVNEEQKKFILRDNVIELYSLPIAD